MRKGAPRGYSSGIQHPRWHIVMRVCVSKAFCVPKMFSFMLLWLQPDLQGPRFVLPHRQNFSRHSGFESSNFCPVLFMQGGRALLDESTHVCVFALLSSELFMVSVWSPRSKMRNWRST